MLWYEIKNHTPNVELGQFVVMPNHIHGILVLLEKLQTDKTSYAGERLPVRQRETLGLISPKPATVSAIVRSYKSAVCRHARRLGLAMEWQARFHDHIIRDEKSFQFISEYIYDNPLNWDKDEYRKIRL